VDEIPFEIQSALQWWTTLDREMEKWRHMGTVLHGALAAHRFSEQTAQRLASLTAKITDAEAALTRQQDADTRHRASLIEHRETERRAAQKEHEEAANALMTIRANLEATTAELMQRRRALEQTEAQIRQREQSLREIEDQLRGLAAGALSKGR